MAISLNEALALTEAEAGFDIRFCSYDSSRKTGGELIDLKDCKRVGASHMMNVNDTIVVKQKGRDRHPYVVHNHLIMEVNGKEIYI